MKPPVIALIADSAKIEGGVYFRGQAVVGGTVDLTIARIGGSFQWKDFSDRTKDSTKARLKLTFVKCEVLWHDEKSWPDVGNLRLDGFIYDRIEDQASPNANNQLGWLHRQNPDKFLPQPYEQLVHRLLNPLGFAAGQLAVFQGASEAPLSES